eukprot:587458-Pleurochrysis_carterae.AAC.1
MHGHTMLMTTLLERSACVDAVDVDGRSALWWACEAGRMVPAALLLDGGAKMGALDYEGTSCLTVAVRGDHDGVVCMLLDRLYAAVCDGNARGSACDDARDHARGGASDGASQGTVTSLTCVEARGNAQLKVTARHVALAASLGFDDVEAALRRFRLGLWGASTLAEGPRRRAFARAAPLLGKRVRTRGDADGAAGRTRGWNDAAAKYEVELDAAEGDRQVALLRPEEVELEQAVRREEREESSSDDGEPQIHIALDPFGCERRREGGLAYAHLPLLLELMSAFRATPEPHASCATPTRVRRFALMLLLRALLF